MDNATAALAKINMILHNNPTAEIWQGNTLAAPHFKDERGQLKTFDRVVANVPFSMRAWSTGFDPYHDRYDRFSDGVPPVKNGDYAFLQHIIRSPKSTGKGAVILLHGVLFRGNAEGEIRKNIVKKGYIKGIIGLPPNLFYGTGIPACILVLDKENAGTRQRIAVPLKINDEAVRLFAITKLAWIKKHQVKFAGQARQSPGEYASGESHYYQGNRYLLQMIYQAGTPKVVIRNKTYIDLFVRPGNDLAQRQRVMTTWYRQQLKVQIPPLIEKWQPILGIEVNAWGVKQMKTRWGTCNIKARRIWLNLELAKKPAHCLEYIVVHEMIHLLERLHNARFRTFMDKFMPPWRSYKEELNRFVLDQAAWAY